MANNASQLFNDDEHEQQTGQSNDNQLQHIRDIDKSNENGGSSGPASSSSIANKEKSGGFFRPEGSEAANNKELKGKELAEKKSGEQKGGLYSGSEGESKSLYKKLRLTRRKVAAGGIASILSGGLLFGGVLTTGPLEAITLSHALLSSFSRSDEESSNRMGKLFRYARVAKTGDLAEARVTGVGSAIFGNAIKQLSDIGVEFDRERLTGRPTALNIDEAKLSKQFPEISSMTTEEKSSFIADKLGVSTDTIKVAGEGKFSVDVKGTPIKSVRLLTTSTLKLLDDGKVATAIRARALNKFFDAPSLLHPLSKARAQLEQKAAAKIAAEKEQKGVPKAEAEAQASIEAAAEGETKSVTDITNPIADKGKAAVAEIEDSKNSISSKITGALTFTGFACLAYDTAGAVAKANHSIVADTSAANALSVAATGEQVRYTSKDNDVAFQQLGEKMKSLTDSKGQKVEQGMAMQSLLNPGSKPTGTDLPLQYKQAYSSSSGAKEIQQDSKSSIEAVSSPFSADVVCSKAGLLTQAVIAIGISVGSEIASGGLDSPAVVAAWTAKTAGTAVVSTVATSGIVHLVEDVAIDSRLPQKIFSGPIGGDLLAFGSRQASNIAAVASGAVSLGNTASTLVYQTDGSDDPNSLANQSMFARLFSLKSTNSLASTTLMRLYSQGWSSRLADMPSNLLNIGSSLASTFGGLIPKTSADGTATVASYDWGFPQYGIPDDMLNNPALDDPYANAETVAKVLDSDQGQAYIDKASQCFGVSIKKDADGKWDVTADHEVDTSSLDYEDAGCTEGSGVASAAGSSSTTAQVKTAAAKNSVTISDGVAHPTSKSTKATLADDSTGGVSNWQRTMMFVFDTRTMNAAACFQNDAQSCADEGIGTASPTDTGTGTTPVNSADAPSYCKDNSATGSQKVVCSAWLFNDYGYNDPGHRGNADFLKGFLADVKTCVTGNYGSGCKYAKGTLLVDCSGLVDAAVYDGLGVDLGGAGTSGYPGNSHLTEIPFDQAQAGDIVWRPGHTEVIVSNDTANKKFNTFGAHMVYSDVTKDISPDSYDYSSMSKVYRVVQ